MAIVKIVIDTNVYSALKRGDPKTTELLEKAEEIFIPTVVLGELYAGFNIGKYTEKNVKELEDFLDQPGVYIQNIDQAISERYGILVKILKVKATPIPTNDIWIVATTLIKGAKLATYDSYFKNVPGIVTHS